MAYLCSIPSKTPSDRNWSHLEAPAGTPLALGQTQEDGPKCPHGLSVLVRLLTARQLG